MFNDIMIASGDDLWAAIAFIVLGSIGGIVNHFLNQAKEKREQEKFEATGNFIRQQRAARASVQDEDSWQKVSVVHGDLAAFLRAAKRNKTKASRQRFTNYETPVHNPPSPSVEHDAPHLDIAPLPSHDETSGLSERQDVAAPPAPQPVPVPIPIPVTRYKPAARPAATAAAKYVFQHDQQPDIQDDDTGESSTHRIVANADVQPSASEFSEGGRLAGILRQKNDLRRAFVLSEILARPLAMRGESMSFWDM